MSPNRPLSATAAKKEARLQRRRAAVEARSWLSPPGDAPDRLRVATWNLNSLRARLPAVERFLKRARPDIACLQETKTTNVSSEAADAFARLGYSSAHIGQGSYNGVTIVARHPIREVMASGEFGDEHLDREPRLITCIVDAGTEIRVASTYVPHGRTIGHWHYDFKLAFLDALADRVGDWVTRGRFVIGGDFNVAPTDSDIFHPDAFVGLTHVTPPERDAFRRLLQAGLVDLDAQCWGPRERRFTWWNHGISYSRNLGMRIDFLASDRVLARCLDTTWIDHVERGADRPSDHAALIADFFDEPATPTDRHASGGIDTEQ